MEGSVGASRLQLNENGEWNMYEGGEEEVNGDGENCCDKKKEQQHDD